MCKCAASIIDEQANCLAATDSQRRVMAIFSSASLNSTVVELARCN